MNIEYDIARGVVVLTVENPPLPTTKHTIVASALADGTVVLADEIARLTAEAEAKLAAHNIVLGMLDE